MSVTHGSQVVYARTDNQIISQFSCILLYIKNIRDRRRSSMNPERGKPGSDTHEARGGVRLVNGNQTAGEAISLRGP